MYGKNRAFSLIELICATSLMLILTITVLEFTFFCTSYAGKTKTDIKSEQVLDNFFDYIYSDVVKKGSKIIKDDEYEDYILRYMQKDFLAKKNVDRKEKLRTVVFDEKRQKIYILTKNTKYKSEYSEVTEGKNILLENVESAVSRYEDDMVIIDIVMDKSYGKKSKSIKFKL